MREAVRGNGPVDETGIAPRIDFTTHRSTTMRTLIAARDWLTVAHLPPYAPELKPVEAVWSHLKRSLANLSKHDIGQLTLLVKTRLKRMQYRPDLINGYLTETGLADMPALARITSSSWKGPPGPRPTPSSSDLDRGLTQRLSQLGLQLRLPARWPGPPSGQGRFATLQELWPTSGRSIARRPSPGGPPRQSPYRRV
ncbi:transposase, partial [Streptomyces sp. NPDC007100]|uniref:transposase n=1 Tax=Streptomyces sp. NPDC007100 TaxID=3155602 RepID=UPI003405FE11